MSQAHADTARLHAGAGPHARRARRTRSRRPRRASSSNIRSRKSCLERCITGRAARGRRIRDHGEIEGLHRRRRPSRTASRTRRTPRASAGAEISLEAMHGDRPRAYAAHAPGQQLHFHRGRERRAAPGRLHALQLRARRFDHAAALPLPARCRTSAGTAALHLAAIRRPGLLPAARRHRARDPRRRRATAARWA